MVSHHPAMFGCHRHCGRRDVMVLVLSRDLARPDVIGRVIFWVRVLQVKSPSCQVW